MPGEPRAKELIPMSLSSPGSPPAGHIWFFLESNLNDPEALYLEIPLERTRSLCLKSVKYLRFLAYAILAVDGTIAHDQPSGQNALADESQLDDGESYIFVSCKYPRPLVPLPSSAVNSPSNDP